MPEHRHPNFYRPPLRRIPNPQNITPVIKVISGGQIGPDIAALRAAHRLGIPTGGHMPKNFRTKEGPHPDWGRKFGMTEDTTLDYRKRTRLNVENSDGTIRFMYDPESGGEIATLLELNYAKKPYLDIFFDRDNYQLASKPRHTEHRIRRWLIMKNIQILNVAGNSNIYLEYPVEHLLIRVLGSRKTDN